MKTTSSLLFPGFILCLDLTNAFSTVGPRSLFDSPSRVAFALNYASSATVPLPPSLSSSSSLSDATSTAIQPKTLTNSRRRSSNDSLRPAHIQEVLTLQDYNRVVGEEKECMVVVRFYAPWCRSCKAMAPSYFKLSNELNNHKVKFVDCPVTPHNADMHAVLGVTTVPFVHVYHPSAGLVEQRKLSRKYYSSFEKALRTYLQDSCELRYQEEQTESDTLALSPWDEHVFA